MAGAQPLNPIDAIRVEAAATNNGFGLAEGAVDGWRVFTGLGVPHRLWIARAEAGWWVGLAHQGAMRELAADAPPAPEPRSDGGVAVRVPAQGNALEETVRRLWRLARSLPTAPLDDFAARTRDLPRTTEAERLVLQRVGQDVFRDALLAYWGGACPLTGVGHPRLLRASHLKPWAACASDAERLDVHNGLLLAAHLDAAFDAGLISFTDDGALLVADALAPTDRAALDLESLPVLDGIGPEHRAYLAFHRSQVFARANGAEPPASE